MQKNKEISDKIGLIEFLNENYGSYVVFGVFIATAGYFGSFNNIFATLASITSLGIALSIIWAIGLMMHKLHWRFNKDAKIFYSLMFLMWLFLLLFLSLSFFYFHISTNL